MGFFLSRWNCKEISVSEIIQHVRLHPVKTVLKQHMQGSIQRRADFKNPISQGLFFESIYTISKTSVFIHSHMVLPNNRTLTNISFTMQRKLICWKNLFLKEKCNIRCGVLQSYM